MKNKKTFQNVIVLIIFTSMLCLSCHNRQDKALVKKSSPIFNSWDTDGKTYPKVHSITMEQILPAKAFPWAGTVSHHLLAGKIIDEWFITLKKSRDVDLFYVLSPSHWNLSINKWSITDGSWNTKNGLLLSDKAKAKTLAGNLNVGFEHNIFQYEHGVSILTPYIKKYFPNAKIVVIAYNGEPPVNMNTARKFQQAMNSVFSLETAKQQKSFLLISTDFSHHSNLVKTNEKDCKSRLYLSSLDPNLWTFAICDNRPALYLLSKLTTKNTKTTIQYATNAYELTDETDPEDITSYFFTYFWEDIKD